ncbi:AAA family ATPase [[Haemophilus] felis]|nr:AAA family ATPase [[Haemophilus] felis]
MKIIRINFSNVNGYLDIDRDINDDINIFTGINGSGKTTILKIIVSLLSEIPDVDYLSSIFFSKLSIFLYRNDGREYEYFCLNSNGTKKFGIRVVNENTPDELQNDPAIMLEFPDFYNKKKSHDIIKQIKQDFSKKNISFESEIIYLDLQRSIEGKVKDEFEIDYYRPFFPSSKLFENLISESRKNSEIIKIQNLVKEKYIDILKKHRRMEHKLQGKIIKSTFDFINIEDVRNKDEITQEIIEKKEYLIKEVQNIDGNIKKSIVDFFDNYEKIKELPDNNPDKELTISYNYKQFVKMNEIIKSIDDTKKQKDALFYPINHFVETLNSFFSATRKKVEIGNRGDLLIKDRYNNYININDLSSGETQIFIIIGNLIFNNNSSKLLIIDEPELSLHIKWQDTLRTFIINNIINSKLQLIFATHSPDLIVDLDEKCINLNKYV